MAEPFPTGDGRLVVAELAYKEAVRGSDRRSPSLDNHRERAATIFTVAVLVTTFFGQAIGTDLRMLSWAAILVFVFGVVIPGILIFLPVNQAFGLKPSGILDKSPPDMTGVEAVEKVTRGLETAHDQSMRVIKRMAILLQIQCAALTAEVVFWTIDLAGR